MFYHHLHAICKEKGTTVTAVVKELGLSSGNMSNWKNGRLPKTGIAIKLANYLGVSVEQLLHCLSDTVGKLLPHLRRDVG